MRKPLLPKTLPMIRCADTTVITRIRYDQTFAQALVCEAATALLNGDATTTRRLLRILVNATLGFEEFASRVAKPSKSLHRMLSTRGNPSMNTLSLILHTLCQHLGIQLKTHSTTLAVE